MRISIDGKPFGLVEGPAPGHRWLVALTLFFIKFTWYRHVR